MKIAFLVRGFPLVTETFITRQIAGLIEKGHDVTVFSARKPDEDKQKELFQDYQMDKKTIYTGAPNTYKEALIKTPLQAAKIGLKHPSYIPELFDSIKFGKYAPERIANMEAFLDTNEEFDVVHAHFGLTGKIWNFTKKNKVDKYVVSFYGHDVSRAVKENPDIYDEMFNYTDNLTVLSEDMRQKLKDIGAPKEKIEKIPLSVDTEKFQPKQTQNEIPKILTVARFTEKKGLKYAVEALSQIEQDFEYHLVGDGNLREEIEKQVQEEGLDDQVVFHGWMANEEVKEKMQKSDIFLLPSITALDGDEEGTPTVLLEAQATGLPVVSTYHAGIPEIVKHGETGLLSEEKNLQKLGKNLKELLNSPQKREEFGVNGRKSIIQNYSMVAVTRRLEDLYRDLLD